MTIGVTRRPVPLVAMVSSVYTWLKSSSGTSFLRFILLTSTLAFQFVVLFVWVECFTFYEIYSTALSTEKIKSAANE